VNEDIWDLDDQIRDYERDNDFGAGFIDVARKIIEPTTSEPP